jgi:2-(3-amino-3-carboxypropyl)histidine synthase
MLQEKGYDHVVIPQAKPLSPGEVLGCTSPRLEQHQEMNVEKAIVCFLADGRFHLESTLISNARNGIDTFYRYDPYSKTLTEESYNHSAMHSLRKSAIESAASAQTFGILMGTLGRQGNPTIVQRIRQSLHQHGKRHFLMLVSEITPAKLQLFADKVDAWIQVACPRLSVDWGHHLADKPVLSPYEIFVCLEETTWQKEYPMDFYSQSGGPWSNYYQENRDRQYTHVVSTSS